MKSLSLVWEGTMRRRKLTFYVLNGVYLVRTKSSLSGEKVKHAACFKNTMRAANRLGRASTIAATVYKQLPEGWKLLSIYRTMVGIATRMLKTPDCSDVSVNTALHQYLNSIGYCSTTKYQTIKASAKIYVEKKTGHENNQSCLSLQSRKFHGTQPRSLNYEIERHKRQGTRRKAQGSSPRAQNVRRDTSVVRGIQPRGLSGSKRNHDSPVLTSDLRLQNSDFKFASVL